MRLLRCIWRGTHKPAGGYCDANQRPTAIRMCDTKSLKLKKCLPNKTVELDNNTFQRKSTKNNQKSDYLTTKLKTTTTITTKFFLFNFDITTNLPKNNTKIIEYYIWKEKNTTPKLISLNSHFNLQKNLPTFGIKPFKGWERWRGWKLYNWPPPQTDLRRLFSY